MSFLVNEKKWPANGSVAFLEVVDKYKDKIDWSNIETFIECGSGETGDNAIHFSNFFKVISIENNSALHERYKDREGINYEVSFVLGDATIELARRLSNDKKKRFLILLDDHNGHESFIEQELKAIKYNSLRNDHVIVVDDTTEFGNGTYPLQEKFEQLLLDINPDYIIENSEIGKNIQIAYTAKED